MVIVRETKYENSRIAFYEIEEGNPDETVKIKDGKLRFEWHRKKSNANITEHGFSFYLARFVFQDKYIIIDPAIASDRNNAGALGVVEGDKEVMVVIHVKKADLLKGIVRIVSAYYTTSKEYAEMYRYTKALKKVRESMESPEYENELAKLAKSNRRIIEAHKKKMNFRLDYGNEKGWDRGW